MFISWQPDFRRLLYLSFSTNIQILCGGLDAPGSDPLHKISGTVFVAHPGWLFHFYPTKIVWRNCCVPVRYQLPKSTIVRLAIKSFCILDRVGRFGCVATVWVLRTWYIVFFETALWIGLFFFASSYCIFWGGSVMLQKSWPIQKLGSNSGVYPTPISPLWHLNISTISTIEHSYIL